MATPLSNILNAKASISVAANSQQSLDNSTPNDPFSMPMSISWAFGSGASEFDLVFHDTRIVAAAGNEELDLAGSLTDGFGNTLTYANIKVLAIMNVSDQTLTTPAHTATAAIINIGGAAANTWDGPFNDSTDEIILGAGDMFIVTRKAAAGMAVTAGTGDLLRIEETATLEAAYRIALFGDST